MRFHKSGLSTILGLAVIAIGAHAGENTVTKAAETFEAEPWVVDVWSKAKGRTALLADAPPDTGSKKSLEAEARFDGQGFQWFAVHPAVPLVVPGELKSVRLRAKSSDPRCVFALKFKDGWGRSEVAKAKLEWGLPVKAANQWVALEFNVPREWVQPITINGLAAHNWDFQNEARTVKFWLHHLEVTTDLSQVDAETGTLKSWRPNTAETDPKKQLKEPPKTPLLSTDFSAAAVSNVFSRTAPAFVVAVRNWKAGKLSGKVAVQVQDSAGRTVLQNEQNIEVESAANLSLPLKVERFGLYTLSAALMLAGGAPQSRKVAFAYLPDWHELTSQQKAASPYGLNVHGGNEKLRLEPFRAAGLVWFREYAFSYEWLLRAKGADKRYAGWPYYPPMVQRYEDLGLKLLPCLQGAIMPPTVGQAVQPGAVKQARQPAPPVGPDRAWALEIADIISAFPKVTHWELSNEYDLKKENAAAEEPIQWANYRAYHKKFAEIIAALGNGELVAVENGRAGIFPEREKNCVASGDFAGVGVLNNHHYCGVEPPETNFGNFNTGFEALERDLEPALFFDRLRAVQRAAVSDGKARQSWLTEFGWDTLAGHVVTPYEQAAYLPRAWLLALAAGTDKCFWFFDYDGAKPVQFFDGCGLLAADGSPKLSLCALAGLTSVLPNPKYVGEINAGDNTCGYVFENEGKLVAALWNIKGDEGPQVTFQAEQLYDFLGNKLPGRTAQLRLAPVYAVGLSKDDPLYKQTAYSLDTPYLVVPTAGDTVTPVLQVKNNRAAALQATVRMTLPTGWKAEKQESAISVPAGEKRAVPLPFTVNPQEPLGQRIVNFIISEGEKIKEIPLQVLVQTPLIMQAGPIMGMPGKADIKVKVGNRSGQPVSGTLRLQLPASWKTAMPEQKVDELKTREIRELKCEFEWNTGWKPDESAAAIFTTADGKSVQRPIIPKAYRLHKAPALKMDGKLDDWPAAAQLPQWMLGCTLGEPQAKICLAWHKEGLYGAVEVRDSQLSTADPRSFWNGDCLEIFVDTADDKRQREYQVGDHQFWFVPQVAENRVYVGRWKRKDEIPATQYDIPGIQSAAARNDDCYVMEFLIPAAQLQKYRPEVGARLGLSVNLTVKGKRFTREVYWPWTKTDWALANWPKMWGSLELVE